VPRLPSDQYSAHWPKIADGSLAFAPHLLGRRKVSHIRSMPFPGVNHLQTLRAPRRKQLLVRLNRTAKLGNVIAKHLAESTRLQKVALHVDDYERAMSRLEFINIRFCVDTDYPFAVYEDSSVESSK